MRKMLSFVLVIMVLSMLSTSIINLGMSSEPPPMVFVQTYGGEGSESGVVRVVQTSDGGYVLVGRTYSYGAGDVDCWLVKTDPGGNVEWNQTFGGTGGDFACDVVETSDGGYAMAGATFSFGEGDADVLLVKVDSSGNHLWNRTYGGADREYSYSLVRTSDGGYALGGITWSWGAGWEDFLLIKVDSLGNAQWNRTYGGSQIDWGGFDLVQTDDGGFAIVGQGFANLVKTDSNGNQEWCKSYGGRVFYITETADGGYALAGTRSDDSWLVKVDSLGNLQWQKSYGGIGVEYSYSVVETSDGGYILAGNTGSFGQGGNDGWLVKVDSQGNMRWNQTYGGTNQDGFIDIIRTSDGGYAVSGTTKSYGAGDADLWLMKFSSDYAVFDVTKEGENYDVAVVTNSTIQDFDYNSSLNQISFNASGRPSGTIGFCNMTLPKELGEPSQVLVDGISVSYTRTENSTHYFLYFTYEHSTHSITIVISPRYMSAEIDIDPDTLNLKSNGEWITVYIELPEGHDVNNIDVNSILLNATIPVDTEAPAEVGDCDLDGLPDLMVKFDRATVIDWLGSVDYGEDTGKYYEVYLTIAGTVAGRQFHGIDKVKVLRK